MTSETTTIDQDAIRVANRYASLIEKATTLTGRARACETAAQQYRADARANQASAEDHRQTARTVRDRALAHQHATAARDAEAEAAREILAARMYEVQAEAYVAQAHSNSTTSVAAGAACAGPGPNGSRPVSVPADAVAATGNLRDAVGDGVTPATSPGASARTDGSDSMATSSPGRGAGSAPAGEPDPRPVRITTNDTEQSDVVVTPSAGTVRIDLAVGDPEDSDEHESPFVILDATGVAALIDAAAVMEAAERQARAAHKRLDSTLDRLERRRDVLKNKPYESPQATALLTELENLDERKGQLFKRLRQQARRLDAHQHQAFKDLEDQLAPDTDWSPIRAAQRQIMADAGIGADDPFFAEQAEHDDLVDRCADLRRQLQAIPPVPLTPKEQAELAQITAEITETEEALSAQGDDRELAGGTITTQDGSGLTWRTTVRDGTTITHQLASDDDTDVPELTGRQLRQVIQAVAPAGGQAR